MKVAVKITRKARARAFAGFLWRVFAAAAFFLSVDRQVVSERAIKKTFPAGIIGLRGEERGKCVIDDQQQSLSAAMGGRSLDLMTRFPALDSHVITRAITRMRIIVVVREGRMAHSLAVAFRLISPELCYRRADNNANGDRSRSR